MATLIEATEVWKDRANGRCDGLSDGKGGRAWLDGEFRLVELEALCIVLRHHAGPYAEGLDELLKNSV